MHPVTALHEVRTRMEALDMMATGHRRSISKAVQQDPWSLATGTRLRRSLNRKLRP